MLIGANGGSEARHTIKYKLLLDFLSFFNEQKNFLLLGLKRGNLSRFSSSNFGLLRILGLRGVRY